MQPPSWLFSTLRRLLASVLLCPSVLFVTIVTSKVAIGKYQFEKYAEQFVGVNISDWLNDLVSNSLSITVQSEATAISAKQICSLKFLYSMSRLDLCCSSNRFSLFSYSITIKTFEFPRSITKVYRLLLNRHAVRIGLLSFSLSNSLRCASWRWKMVQYFNPKHK